MSDYRALVSRSIVRAEKVGLTGPFDLPDAMRPHQVAATTFALEVGRCALFLDTGLGKSLCAFAWGNDGEGWVGKRAQLFYDPDVRYGKDKPGGVRVSHLSDLAGELTVCLQVRKGVVKEYTIKPLPTQRTNTPAAVNSPAAAAETPLTSAGQPSGAALTDRLQRIIDRVNKAPDREALARVQTLATAALAEAEATEPVLHALAVGAIAARNAAFDGDMGDGFGEVDA